MDFLKRIELESSYFKATLFAAIPKKFSGQPILDTKYVLKAFLSASLFFSGTPTHLHDEIALFVRLSDFSR